MTKPAAKAPATQNDAGPETEVPSLGRRVRALRQGRGLTLQQVADRAGLALSTVSKIERDLMAPTYDRFTKLAQGLGVDVSELFADAGDEFAPGEFAIARLGEAGRLETENYVYEMLFPQVRGKQMTPMLGDLKPLEQMRFDRMVSHEGQEFLFVLEGRVIVQAEGRPAVLLRKGESLYLDSRLGHLYASAGDAPARILCVCTALSPGPDEAAD